MKKKEWLPIPEKSEMAWFSEYLVSFMVLNAITKDKKKRIPKYILKDTITVGKKGTIKYEVKY